jgi:hypothetical protein
MNATAYGLVTAMSKSRQLTFVTECDIVELGVTWIASIKFLAAQYSGIWEIDDYEVEICIKDGKSAAPDWITIDFDEFSGESQILIEQACFQELAGMQDRLNG